MIEYLLIAITCATVLLPSRQTDRPLPPSQSLEAASSRQAPEHGSQTGQADSTAALEGLWPSARLTNLLLQRWADDVSHEFGLQETQQSRLRTATLDRWSPFLQENRSRIQPLVNEFLEMRLAMNPPTKEQMQAWANRALPVLDEVRAQFNKAAKDVREILSPAQRAKFEARMLELSVGMQVAESRLQRLGHGEFDPKQFPEFWQPTAGRRRNTKKAKGSQEPSQPTATEKVTERPDQISLELQEWDRYVDKFIQLYHLDKGQQNAVASFLTELKQRALAHRDRRRVEIARLEEQISTCTGTPKELADLKKKLTELYGPIDDMFKELQARLQEIPTAQQRAVLGRSGRETED